MLAFVLIALDRIAIEDELGSKYAAADIAEAVAFLYYLKPEERPAWLDRLSRRHWRYILSDEGELEAETPKRRQANIARLRAALGPDHDANFVHFDPPQRLRRGIRMLKTASTILKKNVFLKLSKVHCTAFAGTKGSAWKARAAASARMMLVAGPASATQTMSSRGWFKLRKFTGTGLA